MRFLVVAAVIGASFSASPLAAQDNRAAYEVALKCFIANASADSTEQRAGNADASARYRASARQTFDALVVLGVALGKDRARIEEDIRVAQDTELPRMVSDIAYYRSVIGTCRAYGLMPPA